MVLRLHPRLAPIKAAVLPLVKKEGMPERARPIYDALKKRWPVMYDDSAAIGKRYRRQDEAGTPLCITIDGDTLKDGTVTVRERDSMQQSRVSRGRDRAARRGSAAGMSVKFAGVAPVLPVRSVARALEHYRKLGFTANAYEEHVDGEPVYGFLSRGGIELHLARVAEIDPAKNSSACYVYVDDANALHAEWAAAGVAGRLTAPEDTPYQLREFAHVDPDGNLLRVGSHLAR